MKKILYLNLILISVTINSQNIEQFKTEIKEDSSKIESIFFNDGILAKRVWYGTDSKVDSLKSYYASNKLNEKFYYDENGNILKGKQFSNTGELLTSWNFKNGKLLKRIDYKIDYNSKNKIGILKAHDIIKKCNEELIKNPESFRYFYSRAKARAMLSNNTLALKDFKMLERKIAKIIKEKDIKGPNKMQAVVYDYLFSIYASFEMVNHTIHYKIKAIKASSKESRLYYNLGAYLVQIEVYSLGISYLNKAIEMVPKHGFAHWLLGIAYSDLGENEKAMKNINVAFKHEDGIYKRSKGTAERDLRTTRGLLYHRLGNSKKGVTDLKEALKINKNNSFALRNIGVIYHDLGKYSKACKYLSKAKDLGYKKTYDRNDLQNYLSNACNNSSEFKTIELTKKPTIYSNPTKDFVYFKNFDFENFNYAIYNFESKLIKQAVSNKKSIDFSNFTEGLYIIVVKINSETYRFKVVKE